MKILFLGDASNYQNCVGRALAAMGHDVTVASGGSRWMNTRRDINIYRRPGLIGGAMLYCRLLYLSSSQLRGYDIVQLADPVFAELKPHRLRPVFDIVKKHNGKVFLSSLANDTQYVRLCLDPDGPLRYNEYRVEGEPTPYAREHPEIEHAWTHPPLSDWTRYVHDNVDGFLSALYEYHIALASAFTADRFAYAGVPVDMPDTPVDAKIGDGPIRIMVASHKGREKEKGVDVLLDAIREVVDANPGLAEIDIVQNVPFEQFRDRLNQSHIVVDQLYSYTPGTTALMAMARGKAVVSGGEEEYYRFIGERDMRPIINPDPRDIPAFKHRLEKLLKDPSALQSLMAQGPAFVAKHNSADLVARRMLDFWQSH